MILGREIDAKTIRYHWSVTEAFTGYVLALSEKKEQAEAKREELIQQALETRQVAEVKIESDSPDERMEGSISYRQSYEDLRVLGQTKVIFRHDGEKYPVKNPYGIHTHSETDDTHGTTLKSPSSFANQEIDVRPSDITRGTNHHS